MFAGDRGLRRTEFRRFPRHALQGALHDDHQSLTAGIHDAGLLQHRKQLRSLLQCFVARLDDVLCEGNDVRILILDLGSAGAHGAGHCQDGPFLRLHDCLVGRLRGADHGCGKHLNRDLSALCDLLGKSPQKLRKNDAGVSAGTAKRPG